MRKAITLLLISLFIFHLLLVCPNKYMASSYASSTKEDDDFLSYSNSLKFIGNFIYGELNNNNLLKLKDPCTVAVADFTADKNNNAAYFQQLNCFGRIYADSLSSILVNIPGVTIVERKKLKYLIDEMKLNENPMFETTHKLGGWKGAKYILNGTIIKSNEFYQINFNLCMVEKAMRIIGNTVKVKKGGELEGIIRGCPIDTCKVRGVGYYPDKQNYDIERKRDAALIAAKAGALREICEYVYGVWIESKSIYESNRTVKDVIYKECQGRIRGVQYGQEEYYDEKRKCEIDAEVIISHDFFESLNLFTQ